MTNSLFEKYIGKEKQLLNEPIMKLTFFAKGTYDKFDRLWQEIIVPTEIEFQEHLNPSQKKENQEKFLLNRSYDLLAPSKVFINTDYTQNRTHFLDNKEHLIKMEPHSTGKITINNNELIEAPERHQHSFAHGYVIGKKAILDFYRKKENSDIYLPNSDIINPNIELLNYNQDSMNCLEKIIETMEAINKLK